MLRYKRFLQFGYLVIILSLVAACSSKSSENIIASDDITMFVATDIHYLAKDLFDDGAAFQAYIDGGDGKLLQYTDEIVSAFSKDIKERLPEVLIISGDLTNNGEKLSHLKMAEKLQEIEDNTGTRIYVIPGNHDILNPWARGFQEEDQYITDTVDVEEYEEIYKNYGFEEAVSRDKASLSYLVTPTEDLWLLMLDTSIYDFNELIGKPTTNGQIEAETFEWIRECSKLAKEKNAKIVTVMHHNLFKHSPVLYQGFTLDNNEEAINVFQECGLNIVLSGHIHIQDIKKEQEAPIYDIVTSALSVNPIQYGVITYSASQGFDYSTSRVNVDGWAKEKGIVDKNLINFAEYSENYFAERAYERAFKRLESAGGYTNQEIEKMAKVMSELNLNYFAGTVSDIKDEIMKSEGYQLWSSADSESSKNYIISMLPESNTNQNQIHIPNQE